MSISASPGGDAPARLVLASASPRRRVLLARLGLAFDVLPAGIDEASAVDESPEALVERLAREKAHAVARRLGPEPPRVVLGCDTIVVLAGTVFGKPDDPEHAVKLLSQLCGRTHRVLTGIAAVRGAALETRSRWVESHVTLRSAGPEEIRAYVATGEPLDKAGAYALQGEGRALVEKVVGSESNVIGLPLDQTCELLRDAGLSPVTP